MLRGLRAPVRTRCLVLLLAVVSVTGLGCVEQAYVPPLTCPTQGGREWTEIRSSHFVMKTDLAVAEAERITTAVEILRAALLTALDVPAGESTARTEIVLFRRREDFHAVRGNQPIGGYFSPRFEADVELDPVIVSYGGLTYTTRSTLLHEVTHGVVRSRTGRVPWWLNEGLAELFSTLWVRDLEKGIAVVGDPPLDVDFWEGDESYHDGQYPTQKTYLPRRQAPSFDELLNVNRATVEASGRMNAFYAASWKLLHVLHGRTNPSHAPRFRNMISALMNGTDGRTAFDRAYRDVLITDIGQEYERLLLDHSEHPVTLEFDVPANLDLADSTMSDAEVHALWARALSTGEGTLHTAADELERGEAENPGALPLAYTRASLGLRTGHPSSISADVTTLQRAEPQNPRYKLVALLDAASTWRREGNPRTRERKRGDLVKIVEEMRLLPMSPIQASSTATILSELGRTAEALDLSAKATKAGPWCAECFFARATILVSAGEATKAKEAAERALGLTPEASSTARVLALLARIEKEIAKRSPAAASSGP